MSVFSKTVFVESAAEIERLPADGGREVAFVGRSNAGKSSTINALTGIGRLAFVSKQPGRTQLINLFEVTPGHRIVDLPGYGYAKVAKDIKRDWGILLERYLQERQELAALVVIMDIRHPLTPLDVRLIEWIAPRGLPLHVVLSKSDKLTRQQQGQVVREVTEALAPLAPLPVTVQSLSSPKRTGLDTLAEAVAGFLGIAAKAPVSSSELRGARKPGASSTPKGGPARAAKAPGRKPKA
jgi:GTP-binding protein